MNKRILIHVVFVVSCIQILFGIGCGFRQHNGADTTCAFPLNVYEKPPEGFSPADSIRIYGTSERTLKDGTIFDYINGGGLVYLNHGLRETTHMVFHDDSGNRLTVDFFDMGNSENALSAFNDEKICPAEFISCNIGTECKAYNFEPDFLIYFHTSNYLVYLGINNDNLRKIVEEYALEIHGRISDED